MKFKFIGRYTGGRDTITMGETTFEGHDPADVDDPEMVTRLLKNPEFEAIGPLDHDGDGKKGGSVSATGGDLTGLRATYLAKFGKKAFNGWDADKLREKLA